MKLHHIGFVCTDLERTLRRFVQEGAEAISAAIADHVQQVVVQFLRVPQIREVWELVAPLGDIAASPLQGRLRRGGGMDHVCYELEGEDGSLESAIEAERRRGARVICPPVQAAAFARRIGFVFRRSGLVVELVEPCPPGALL